MAKATLKKTVKATGKTTKPGRTASAKTTKIGKAASAKKTVAAKAPPLSKEELRAQLAKSQNTIVTLRAKNKEATLGAKAAAARIAELEAQVAKLEKNSSAQKLAKTKPDAAVRKPRVKRVPPSVAEEAPVASTEPEELPTLAESDIAEDYPSE